MNLEENKTLFPDEAITIFLCIDGDEPELSGRIEDIRNKIRFRGQEEILCAVRKIVTYGSCFEKEKVELKKKYYVRPGKLCTLQLQFYARWNGKAQGSVIYFCKKGEIKCQKIFFRSELELMKLICEASVLSRGIVRTASSGRKRGRKADGK